MQFYTRIPDFIQFGVTQDGKLFDDKSLTNTKRRWSIVLHPDLIQTKPD